MCALAPLLAVGQPSLEPTALRTEQVTTPLGIEAEAPRLSWQLRADERGARQTAYRMQVARSKNALTAGEDLLWDSGKVSSDQSVHVAYDGPSLDSRERYWRRVRVWGESGTPSGGTPSDWSASTWWEMGLLQKDDWQARWISARPPTDSLPPPRPAPLLWNTFDTDKPVERARLYVSDLGLGLRRGPMARRTHGSWRGGHARH